MIELCCDGGRWIVDAWGRVSGAVGEVELVSWMGAVGVMRGADW